MDAVKKAAELAEEQNAFHRRVFATGRAAARMVSLRAGNAAFEQHKERFLAHKATWRPSAEALRLDKLLGDLGETLMEEGEIMTVPYASRVLAELLAVISKSADFALIDIHTGKQVERVPR